jgi:hypothetical protein
MIKWQPLPWHTVFISLDKQGQSDFLTPETVKRNASVWILVWNYLQNSSKSQKVILIKYFLRHKVMKSSRTQFPMTNKKKWHPCFPVLQNGWILQAVTCSLWMEECAKPTTQTPNWTEIYENIFKNSNYSNLTGYIQRGEGNVPAYSQSHWLHLTKFHKIHLYLSCTPFE